MYHLSQKASFPKVDYTLTAAYYFIIAYVFVVSVTIGIIYIQTMQSQGKKEQAKWLNQMLALGALLAIVTIYAGLTYLRGFAYLQ